MQKVILDTNVVVSALIQKSFPYLILYESYIDRKIELCVSPDLLKEYHHVLKREKFSRFPDFAQMATWVLNDMESNATIFHPQNKTTIIADDADNRLLELAQISRADYIITGNTNDFTMAFFENTKIVSPKDYWELYR
jgi:putative PIN family toxin of toxin-antitoxin system